MKRVLGYDRASGGRRRGMGDDYLGCGRGAEIKLLKEIRLPNCWPCCTPHSLAISGSRSMMVSYKVMGASFLRRAKVRAGYL